MAMSDKVDRESIITLAVIAGLFVLAIAFFGSQGAFAKPPEGPKPKLPPEPTPTPPAPPPEPPPEAGPPVPVLPEAPPADAPAWLLAGGVPPVEGRELLGWYSYRGFWIRVDGEQRPGGTPGSGTIYWTVVGGDATPLASAKAFDETATFVDADENLDEAANRAARWIDAALAAGVSAPGTGDVPPSGPGGG